MAVRVSVCTTHLEDWPAVQDFWSSLASQLPQDAEVVLVDAGSRGPARTFLEELAKKEPRFRLILEPGCTRGRGRDLAWRAAHGAVILHTDADRTWRPDGWSRVEDVVPRLKQGPIKLRSALGRIGLGGYLLTRDHLQTVGGYDETLQYFEDVDLERRLKYRLGLQEFAFDVYAHDSKAKMRRVGTNLRYYYHMFHDGARIGESFSFLAGPSWYKPWRWPFLVAGWFGYRRGRQRAVARFLRPGEAE